MKSTTELQYCPACGIKQFHAGDFNPWKCPVCRFQFYQNTATAAGALIFNKKGELLTVRRAKMPSKGKLGIPGGFLDRGETAEIGLCREVMEEVNLRITDIQYLCSFPNEYMFQGICYHTIDLYFTAQAVDLKDIKALDEVSDYEWHDPAKLKAEELSFPSFVMALDVWLAKHG